jgi:hypothetical protein
VTPDAFQSTFTKTSGDLQNAFLTKINAAGSALLYSSYLAGEGDDVATAVAIDQTGDAYVGGHTTSVTFPTTLGVTLVGPATIVGQTPVVGTEGRTIDVAFDLNGAALGMYSAVVTSNGSVVTFQNDLILCAQLP